MEDSKDNLAQLKGIIDDLDDHWHHDQPTNPDKYEGLEHLIVFVYNMTGSWPEFWRYMGGIMEDIETLKNKWE